MAGIYEQFLSVGVETTYGTAVGLARSYEGQSDDWQRDVEYIESQGFREGLETTRSDRYEGISTGATGSTSLDVMNKGMGLILQHALGASSGPTQVGSTIAYTAAFTTNSTGPTGSYTWQMVRVDSGGTARPFTYEGCVCTGVDIEMALGANLNMTLNWDSETEQTSSAAPSPTYVASTTPFPYTTASVEIDDSAVTNVTAMSISLDNGLDTERRFLKGAATKGQPKRSSVPAYTGSMTAEFASLTDYNSFVNSSNVKLELICTQTTAIVGSSYPYVHITMPAVRFTGSSPVASLDALTSIEIPFTILDDGTNAAVTIATQSSDSAF